MTFERVQKSGFKASQPTQKRLSRTAVINTEQVSETPSNQGEPRAPQFQHNFSQIPLASRDVPEPIRSTGSLQSQPIQRYVNEGASGVKVSDNALFAVKDEGRNGTFYIADSIQLPKLQHIDFNVSGVAIERNSNTLKRVTPTFADEEAVREMYCGEFSYSATGIRETEENEQASVGRSLYANKLTGEQKKGWENHFATVVATDGSDRATLETAVGLDYWWFGIYGNQKGQSFRFKTQQGNIDRQEAQKWISPDEANYMRVQLDRYVKGLELTLAHENDWIGEEISRIETARTTGKSDLEEVEPQATPVPENKVARTRRLLQEQREDAERAAQLLDAIKQGRFDETQIEQHKGDKGILVEIRAAIHKLKNNMTKWDKWWASGKYPTQRGLELKRLNEALDKLNLDKLK